VHQTRPDKAG